MPINKGLSQLGPTNTVNYYAGFKKDDAGWYLLVCNDTQKKA